MTEKLDSTGRLLLDHIADAQTNAPDQTDQLNRLFWRLHGEGRRYTEWSTDAAIRGHNYALLRWLRKQPGAQLALDKLTWIAVHCRNSTALEWAAFEADHYEVVALDDDTHFLGTMRPRPDIKVSIAPFHAVLNDPTTAGAAGLYWLLRRDMIDLDTINAYQHEQIVARFGARSRILLSP